MDSRDIILKWIYYFAHSFLFCRGHTDLIESKLKSVRRRQEDIKRVVEKLKARYSCLTAAEEFLLLFAMPA